MNIYYKYRNILNNDDNGGVVIMDAMGDMFSDMCEQASHSVYCEKNWSFIADKINDYELWKNRYLMFIENNETIDHGILEKLTADCPVVSSNISKDYVAAAIK